MDVNRTAFPARILQILEALSECHFVSLDFEFSGVSSKPQTRQKQTIQERYTETKQAAERYSILQVGLTCAVYDRTREVYVLKPYNLPLSPTFQEDLDLERIFSFQSGAVDFLLKNNFDFNTSLRQGVPYLSRDEEDEAKLKFRARADKSRFEDIMLPEDDVLSSAYLDKVRAEILDWMMTGHPSLEGVEIMSRTEKWSDCEHYGNLTGFDKRLVHQLVRAEYPELVSMGRKDSIMIKRKDEEREHRMRKERYKKLKLAIYRQYGFRWIIEAMTRGSLSNIDLSWCARDPDTGAPGFYNEIAMKANFDRAADRLKRRSPVLVGHNLFTDLIYLYQAFVGKLPDTIGEFRLRIHNLFPTIVDTKYMATHNCGNLNPASSLEEVEEALQTQFTPRIQVQREHSKYVTEEHHHEAGYDSYLTARIMILLSAKLEAAGTYVEDETTLSPRSSNATSPPTTPSKKNETPGTSLVSALMNSTKAMQIDDTTASKTPSPMAKSRYASRTMFDALESTSDNQEASTIAGANFALNPTARPFPIAATGDGAADSPGGSSGKKSSSSRKSKEMKSPKGKGKVAEKEPVLDAQMPPFNTDFWRLYANRLRVFGTVEGLLDLDPMRMA